MTILVIIEHNDEVIVPATLNTISAALQLKGPIEALVVGNKMEKISKATSAVRAISKVLVADAAEYKHSLAENLAPLIAQLAENYSHILAPATTFGKNVLPRAAALLDVMQSRDPLKLITVRSTAFEAVGASGGSAEIEKITGTGNKGLSEFKSSELSGSERPELTSASIVISGGRGMQDSSNFSMLEDVADKLGAAVGASRAAVDAGFAPNDYQVGQTGKVVAPELYMAVGISGAIQHLAGMKDSKVIVAINKDEEAPIFQVADYGLVADLFDAMPELDNKLT